MCVRSRLAARCRLSAASVATLGDIETRAQEHLRLGQDLMAADLLSSDGRSADEAVASGLRTLRAAENDAFATARADALDSLWTIAGAVAVFWVVGLILLMRQPSVVVREESPALAPGHTLLAPADAPRGSDAATSLDLQAAADVCTAIGQTDERRGSSAIAAASGLGAGRVWSRRLDGRRRRFVRGGGVWLPAARHAEAGPDQPRRAQCHRGGLANGTLQVVSGDQAERSALAAPMLGPDRCIGVLAVEVGSARRATLQRAR